jgi:hypothetical protein
VGRQVPLSSGDPRVGLRRLAEELGQGPGAVGTRVKTIAQRAQISRQWTRFLDRASSEILPTPARGRVVVFAMIGRAALERPETSLGLHLARRGYLVEAVFCDASRAACELSSVVGSGVKGHLRQCAACIDAVDRNWGPISSIARVRLLSDLIDGKPGPAAAADAGWIDGLDAVAEHQVLVRVLRRESVKGDDHPSLAMQLRQSAALSALAARALLAEGPVDHVLMSHGIYVSWAPARRVFEEAGVDIIVYDRGPRRGSLIADRYDRSNGASLVRSEYEQRWRQTEFSAEHRAEIDTYLNSRRNPSGTEHPYSFGPERSRAELCNRLRLDPAKAIVVVFPNLLWDAASYGRNRLYASVAEWVRETVRLAGENGMQLVVRTHPAEALRGTAESVQSVLDGAPWLTSPGIIVLDPADQISTGSLQHLADLAIVNTSTVGLECATLGTRVVTTADSHYTGLGFTEDPKDRSAYEALLVDSRNGQASAPRSDVISDAALRYAHYYFVSRPFLFAEGTARDGVDWFVSPKSLRGMFHALDNVGLAPIRVQDGIQ